MKPQRSVCCLIQLALLLAICPVRGQVVLNEICAENGGAVMSPGGTTPDYIELYNPSASAVNLSTWTLTDNPTVTNKFQFPPGTSIPARGFLMVWLEVSVIYPGLVTTNFSLKSSGEEVALYQNGTRRDYVKFGPQVKDLPLSRLPNGTGDWTLGQPSPLATNKALTVGSFGVSVALRLNEWLSTNSAGASLDWLELYNPKTNGIVALGGLVISDLTSTVTNPAVIPHTFIDSGGFIRFWCDGSTNKGDHLDFKLSSSAGETITLYQTNRSTIIDRVSFGAQARDVSMGRLPDGGTNFILFAGTNSMSPGLPNAWKTSTNIIINEVLTHTDPPLEDALELFNPTAAPVDISHWWISNDSQFPYKFRVPAGTVLPAGGYQVFYEQSQASGASATPGFNRSGTDNAPDFTFNSAHGDTVFLCEATSGGALTGFAVSKTFGAAANGVSFGRHLKSDGGTDLVPMAARTFGSDTPATVAQFRTGAGLPNAYPHVGPLVISEILYFPPPIISGSLTNDNTLDEFIELTSVTNGPLQLFDPNYPTNRWQISGGVGFTFPTNITLAANASVLLVNFDPKTNTTQLAAFRSRYGVSTNVPVFGPYSGKLNNAVGTVQLEKPDPVQLPPHPDAGFVPSVLVEKVKYETANGWPTNAAGSGFSLQRLSLGGYANDHTNWFGAAPSAGQPSLVGTPPSITVPPANAFVTLGTTASFTVIAAGSPPLAYQWRFDGANLPGANALTLTLNNAQTNQSGSYTVIVSNGSGSITSAPAYLSVAGPPGLAGLSRALNGVVQFTLDGRTGHVYQIEATRDFINWTILGRLTNSSGLQLYSDPAATNVDHRFYRSRVAPD